MLVEGRRPVVAATFDHGLRPDSASDVAAVERICARLGVALIKGRRTEPLRSGSVQAAAREARYAFLESAASTAGADMIAVAHTADDLVETVVMNVLRGSGLRGLRGMPECRGRIVRPLLGVTRAEIELFLRERGFDDLVVRDPSNADLRFLRARVRHQLIPAIGPSARARLRLIAEQAAKLQLEPEPSPGLTRVHRTTIARLRAEARTGASLSLPNGVTFRVLPGGGALFEPPGAGSSPTAAIRERGCPGCDDSQAIHVPAGARVEIGYRTPGLRLRPRGGAGTRKLQDLLVDAKFPRHLRARLPLVFVDGSLAWVPGIAEDSQLTLERNQGGRHVWLDAGPAAVEDRWKGDGIFGRQSPLAWSRGAKGAP